MNLAELRSALDRRTGTALDADARDEFLNQALQEIAVERDWPWLQASTTFTTVAGTAEYVMPYDWLRTIAIVVEGSSLDWRSIAELDELAGSDGSATGTPAYWGVYGDRLILRPAASSAVTVTHRYLRFEPTLESASDEPGLPAPFHTAIVELAAVLVHRRTGDKGRAAAAQAAYDRWRELMSDDQRRTARPGRPRVRPGGWL